MLGRKSGFQAHVKAMSPKATFVHCFITKICSFCQDIATGIIIMLKSNHQNCEFHKSISAEYIVVCKALRRSWFRLQTFPHHTEVHWLSQGNMTRRVFELREELIVFFREKKNSNLNKNDLESKGFILSWLTCRIYSKLSTT